jgi:hypothetical protein
MDWLDAELPVLVSSLVVFVCFGCVVHTTRTLANVRQAR